MTWNYRVIKTKQHGYFEIQCQRVFYGVPVSWWMFIEFESTLEAAKLGIAQMIKKAANRKELADVVYFTTIERRRKTESDRCEE